MAPGDLDKALCGLEIPHDPNVLVGLEGADDAGVYRIADDLAIIQTVDFFTPIVDDPFRFGQIAAANALSDIYAMGGEPKTAMNLVAFPSDQMDISVLRAILEGGLDKMKEAGVVLLGGHSVQDKELKYGLSITGFVHPDRVIQNTGLKTGDQLILTKPLGTGIINTAIKGNIASPNVIEAVTRLMATLNRAAADVMKTYPVSACTDVTGFGLLGHLAEMLSRASIGVRLESRAVPVIPEALEYAKSGFIPGGTFKNKSFRSSMVSLAPHIDTLLTDILFDPQTSGGLLMGIASDAAGDLLRDLKAGGVTQAAIIGQVISQPAGKIIIA
jgi:selenide,water dikinase